MTSLRNERLGCQSPSTKLTKRPASNSSQAKASNEKVTTISSPILTAETTSGRPFIGCEPSMMHARPDGAEPAPSVGSDQAALLVGKVPPRGSSLTGSLEEIGAEAETSPGTERIARTSQFKSPRVEAATDDKDECPAKSRRNRPDGRRSPDTFPAAACKW